MSEQRMVTCACGFEATGTLEELIAVVRQHGRDLHNMDVTPEEVRAMTRPVATESA